MGFFFYHRNPITGDLPEYSLEKKEQKPRTNWTRFTSDIRKQNRKANTNPALRVDFLAQVIGDMPGVTFIDLCFSLSK